jgi:haloalkane dehalogenase
MDTSWVDRRVYPFESRWASVPGGKLHHIDVGQGPVLLFAHGTPTWSFEWRHVVRALSGRFRCIAPDHLGFGLSDRPRDADYRPEAHAERFAAFVEALRLDRFTLVVHDFGGPIALPLALERPGRIERLVVLNSWMWPFDDDAQMVRRARFAGSGVGRWMYRWCNASLRLIMPSAYGDRRKLTRATHAQYLAPFRERWAREHVLWTLARSLLGSSEHYASLWVRRERLSRVPSTIVWGRKDSAFRPAQLERWRQALPHAHVTELAGAGHWPHEEDPEAVVRAIERG